MDDSRLVVLWERSSGPHRLCQRHGSRHGNWFRDPVFADGHIESGLKEGAKMLIPIRYDLAPCCVLLLSLLYIKS
jgi:hypothetical protein